MKKNIVEILINKGVKIHNPESVYIAQDVDPERISGDNVTIFTGCKIFGKKTLIMKNCTIGYEAPVTLDNTLIGADCNLKGGFFQNALFAGENTFGSGAHVRAGTILEEQANAAHTVGLKQTILFPFVTLGSLINFCDCFMAGGTSRKNHSEVGSSFIHFNYTPNQDKATPSMMGNIHQGVMLKSNPVFLGGQGGLVGPLKIAYGCISAAGSIIRKSELINDQVLFGGAFKEMSFPRQYNIYRNVTDIYNNNVQYIAGLVSLKKWYQNVRVLFIYDYFSKALIEGMQKNLDDCIKERIKRFAVFCQKLENSKKNLLLKNSNKNSKTILNHEKAIENFHSCIKLFETRCLENNLDKNGEKFIKIIEKNINKKEYIKTIQSLEPDEQAKGSKWLFNIENSLIKKLII